MGAVWDAIMIIARGLGILFIANDMWKWISSPTKWDKPTLLGLVHSALIVWLLITNFGLLPIMALIGYYAAYYRMWDTAPQPRPDPDQERREERAQ